ncbi:MAG TPA: DUF2071 domain-containing protein [Thermoanaerobaculia bacterium]|nr:DUF2071 domain-containing protein [Thermoanaerobaculia bacterium]
MHQHDDIDRISPTLEPDQQVLMHQNWHHLLFLHWEVPPMELQALLPPRLRLDTFEGKAYVGLVPFTMTGVRPILLPPLPGVSSLHEINVRTYVHLEGRNPGVWFFSLDASSRLAVEAARMAYHLAYFNADIDFEATAGAIPTISFDTKRTDERGTKPANAHIRYRPIEGPATASAPGTLEHFLLERYILYSQDAAHNLYRARVHHQPYPAQKAEVLQLDETLIWAAGIKRPDAPAVRHYAQEVNVRVYALEKV